MCTVLAFTSYILNTTYIYMKLDRPQHSNLPHSHDRSDFLLAQTLDTHPYLSSLCSGVWTHYRLQQATEDNRRVSYCNTNVNIAKNNKGHDGRVVTLLPPTSEAGVRSPSQPQVGKLVVASLVGSLQYRTLMNSMYWFPLPFQLPVVI